VKLGAGHALKLANDWLALNPDARTKIKANRYNPKPE